MTISTLFNLLAVALFCLGVVPKVQRPWMMGVGMALLAASFLPYPALRAAH